MEQQGLNDTEVSQLAAFMSALDHEAGADWDESHARPVRLVELHDEYVEFEYEHLESTEDRDGRRSASTLYRKSIPLSLLTTTHFPVQDRLRFSGDWQAVEHETKVVKKVVGKNGEDRWHTTTERWREPMKADCTEEAEQAQRVTGTEPTA